MKNKIYLYLFTIYVFIGCNMNKEEQSSSEFYYTCSMDPQVRENKPGNCPICKMPLTAVKKSDFKNDGSLHLSDQQILLGHIQVDSVRNQKIGNEIHLTGKLVTDENKTEVISTRVMGRIEKLYIKTIGESVQKGQAIYAIYSEDLNLTIKELKLAIEKKKTFDKQVIDIDRIIESGRKKLLLYGLSEAQIQQFENTDFTNEKVTIYAKQSGIVSSIEVTEGSYVMEGNTIMSLADYSELWAEAQVFSSHFSEINLGMGVILFIPELNREITGKINFISPQLSSPEINVVRMEISNKNRELKPGMQTDFLIVSNEFIAPVIPTDAILLDSKGATVWIPVGHNKFKSKMVKTGMESNGFTEIISGLKEGDKVVVSGAYLLNSEFIFKKGNNPMEGHDMSKM